MQTNIRRYVLLLMLILVCVMSAYSISQTKVSHIEAFEPMYATRIDNGVPLVLLDTIKPKQQVYFREIDNSDIQELLKSISPSKSINDFIDSINASLQQYDKYTYNIPFRVLQNIAIDKQTSQLLIYRNGKMYGFLLNYNNETGNAHATGFVLEQNINSYKGLGEVGFHTYPLENARVPLWSKSDVVKTLQQQADAINQDRGISASSFS